MKILISVLAFIAGVATAQAQPPGATLAGYGARNCGDLAVGDKANSSFRASQTGLGIVAWAQGYLSGLNAIGVNEGRRTIDLTGGRATELWSMITSECRDNPQKKVEDVVAEIFLHQSR